MPTPTDDRRDLLTLIAYMHAAPGKRDELRSGLEALVEPTRLAAPHLAQFAARIPVLDERGLTVNRIRRIA